MFTIILKCTLILTQFNLLKCVNSSSLTFVIDDTRSMTSDIDRVKKFADAILDTVLIEKSNQIKEFILVTFNDPGVKLRIKTSDRSKFKSELSSVVPNNYFNNGCPEMALTGVKLGLEISRPGSYIYVLTDATAKDYRIVDSIITLCEKTQSQVVFILTGDCRRPNGKGSKVYYEIAAASSGQVFRVEKNEIDSVLEVVQETLKSNKRLVNRDSLQPHENSEIPFTVDDGTEYVIVSASATDVTLNITGPSTDVERIIWTTNVKVVKISDPAVGSYSARVLGSNQSSVSVYAKSNFAFQYGFSEVPPKKLEDTSSKPVAGTENYLAISVTDPNNETRVQSAQILDKNGNITTELLLKKVSDNFYTTGPFAASTDMFKIAVTGLTKASIHVRRISKRTFQPEPPTTAPEVTITEGARAGVEYGSDLVLTCKVTAFPEPVIVWKDDKDNILLSKTTFNDVVERPNDRISYLQLNAVKISKKYICNAKNYVGESTSAINVIVDEPFNVISAPPENLNIKQGDTAKIRCDITSKLPMQITWYHVDGYGNENKLISSNTYTISRDQTELVLNAINSTITGKYICKAFLIPNDGANIQFTINIGLNKNVAPVIDKTTDVIEIQEMDNITIPCTILQGVPAPVLAWQRRLSKDLPFESVNLYDEEITQLGFSILNAELTRSGDYKCIAENSVGRDEHVTALVVLTKPEIAINEGAHLNVPYGNSVSVTCTVTANPKPSINWKDSVGDVFSSGRIRSLDGFKYSNTLTINNVKKSNKYYCLSQNKQGQAVATVEVTALSPFNVMSYPEEITNGVYGTPTKIKCDITSKLPMIITWIYINDKTNVKQIIRISDKYTISSDQTELTINAISFDLLGKYTCKASMLFDDEEFKEFTTEVKLQGLMTPRIIDKNVKNISVAENSPALIQCRVAEVGLKPIIRWEFKALNGIEFLPIPQFGEEMRIPSTVMHNRGYYRCIAENVAGNDDKITELVVTKAPVGIILEGQNTSVAYGNDLVLNCRVLAYSDPKVTWTDSSGMPIRSEIPTAANGNEYTSVLTIPNVKKSEKYHCLAENMQGKASTNIEVTVLLSFEVVEQPKPITKAEFGKPVIVKCDIRFHLPIAITWLRFNDKTREKEIIKPSNKYSISSDETKLTINNADLYSMGKYSCNASLVSDKDQNIGFDTDVIIEGLLYPKIDKNVTTIEVQENTPASIDCKILQGTPIPKIAWQFKCRGSNEFLTIPGTGEAMEIPIAILNNAGYYKCVAENVAGSDDKITDLIVKKIPIAAISEGAKINSTYGRELSMTCKVIAYPNPIITWFDDKGTVLPSETLPSKNEYEYSSLLRVPNLIKSTQFYCRAVNSLGEDAANIDVVVSSILSADPEVTVNVEYGKTTTIQCGVNSPMPTVITWTHVNALTKEMEIVRASEKYSLPWYGSELTIKLMNFDLEGKYSCKASLLFDPEQYAIHNTTVTMNGLLPPKINKTSNSIEVEENSPASIECKLLEGTPTPKISWQFKGRGSREFLSVPGFKDVLYIPVVVLHSAGEYRCVAESSAGRDDKTTELIVTKKPMVIIDKGKKIAVPYGAEVTLTCNVTAYPAPAISWSSDENLLLSSDALTESSDYEYTSRLRILSVKKSLDYSCIAENSQGKVTETIQVTTESAFQVLEYPNESASVGYGKVHKIRCVVTSELPMRLQWFRTISETKTLKISHSTDKYHLSDNHNELTIKSMDSDLAGKYTCKASLLFDADTYKSFDSNIMLTDLARPSYTEDLHKINLLEGETRQIKCHESHTPYDSMKWFMNKIDIKITQPYLTLSDVDVSMDGNYTCQVTSSLGTHSDTYIVDVGYLPVFINYLDTTIIHWPDSENLDCKATAKPEAKVTWTYNGVPVDMPTGVFDLKITGYGEYICNVSNVHGFVMRSFNVTSKGCILNTNIAANKYTPLLIYNSLTMPSFETVNGYLVVEKETVFTLSCHSSVKTPNSFQKFPEEHELKVTCNSADTFWVEGTLYKYEDFNCNKMVLPVVIKSGSKCLGDNTELVSVGFLLEELIEIYQVCFDMKRVIPLYTYSKLHHRNTKIDVKSLKWFRDTEIAYRKIGVEYFCENVLSTMCYGRAQLVSVHDVPLGPAQTSTYIDHVNTVPLWRPDEDSNRITWQAIEDVIRALANVNNEISVWSGASGYIYKDGSKIPRYLWKVVKVDELDTTAIIYVNEPEPTNYDLRCKNTCDGSSNFWFKSTDIFTYCCNFADFVAAFKLPESIFIETPQAQLDNSGSRLKAQYVIFLSLV